MTVLGLIMLSFAIDATFSTLTWLVPLSLLGLSLAPWVVDKWIPQGYKGIRDFVKSGLLGYEPTESLKPTVATTGVIDCKEAFTSEYLFK
jgi:hypothetical protein